MEISIIVPIYNSEKFLHKCVDSILSQTYSDFELLLINDGSKDRSGGICDEYAENDKRVKVFHKKNGGVSSARNLGLDNAKGKYICFIDSDDWVYDRLLESFFILDKDLKTALVQQGFVKEYSNGDIIKSSVPNKIFPATDYSNYFYSFKVLKEWPYLHSKLFSRKIIKSNSIKFYEDVSYGEDLLFILDYLIFSSKVIMINEANYYYTYQDDSLSRFVNSYESENKRYVSIVTKLRKIDDKFNFDDKTKELHEIYFAGYLFRVISSLYKPPHKKKRKDRVEILKKHNSKESRRWVENWNYNSIGSKVYRFLFLNQFHIILDLFFLLLEKKRRYNSTISTIIQR